MEEKESMRPQRPMANPMGTSYPVDVLAQLESDPESRRVFNALPREMQLDVLQHNTMTPEALLHFWDANKARPTPATGLLSGDENSQVYLRTASDEVKEKIWHEKFSEGGE